MLQVGNMRAPFPSVRPDELVSNEKDHNTCRLADLIGVTYDGVNYSAISIHALSFVVPVDYIEI